MSQSLSKVYVHIVFSTKYAVPMVKESVRKPLHSYIVGVLSHIGSYTEELYANPNHLHILCSLPRIISQAQLISKIKTSSTKWLKQHGIENFGWQDGYGIFSISASHLRVVKRYILNQPRHHQKESYYNEVRQLFCEHHIDFDERYMWD